jgi:hypothetical protein
MKTKLLSLFTLAILVSVGFTACIKDELTPLTDQGEAFLKLAEAPENTIFFEPFTGSKLVSLFTISRDAANQNQLITAATVKLTFDPSKITAYNTAHGTNYEVLPDSLYTLAGGITKLGSVYTVPLVAGDFAKGFDINLNGSKWDLSRKYAMAFSITDSAGINISEGHKEVIALISIKNQYDGIYSVVSGSVQRYSAPGVPTVGDALNGDLTGNPDVILATVGPTTVEITNLQWAASGGGVGGIANLRATVDPVTNKVTMFSLGQPNLTNWAGKDNYYDPATKTFYLNFRWNPATTTREYSIVLKYKKPRN